MESLILLTRNSMTGAMLILLAACRVPVLRDMIGKQISAAGHHLMRLIPEWSKITGDVASPSVEQSLRIIAEVTSLAKQERFADHAQHDY